MRLPGRKMLLVTSCNSVCLLYIDHFSSNMISRSLIAYVIDSPTSITFVNDEELSLRQKKVCRLLRSSMFLLPLPTCSCTPTTSPARALSVSSVVTRNVRSDHSNTPPVLFWCLLCLFKHMVCLLVGLVILFFFFSVCFLSLFLLEGGRQGQGAEGDRDRERESKADSTPSMEPDVGLIPAIEGRLIIHWGVGEGRKRGVSKGFSCVRGPTRYQRPCLGQMKVGFTFASLRQLGASRRAISLPPSPHQWAAGCRDTGRYLRFLGATRFLTKMLRSSQLLRFIT